MDRGTVARIEDWSSQDLDGGYAGLRRLADEEFTGAVTANRAWLFMLNGKVLAVVDGTMETYESAAATAYEAPHPSLPLLFAMLETGGEVKAEYYTDDTPMREVDSTLSEAGFTGYIELSENVLSGDYYVVYYGGRSLSAAFVGNAERLITGDEAFERASDEVGIYSVYTVDLDVQDVPGAAPSAAGSTPAETAPAPEGTAGNQDLESLESTDELGDVGPDPLDPHPDAAVGPGGEATSAEASTDDPGEPEEATAPAVEEAEPDQEPAAARSTDRPPDPEGDEGPTPDGTTAEAETTAPPEPAEGEALPGDEDPFSEEEAWRETRTVPALDPDQSQEAIVPEADEADEEPDPAEPSGAAEASRTGPRPPGGSPDDPRIEARVADLESTLEAREETITELRSRLEDVADERDALREQAGELRGRLDQAGAGGGATTNLDPDTALAQTDLFVRYGSKGDATLMDAHDDAAPRDEVTANLRVETHTRFDADTAAVDGVPYRSYLDGRTEYRFVRWLVEDLLFEIMGTRKQRALRDLFDTIPRIDRIELRGSVEVGDDGESIAFDVVVRDRMGRPLLVADVNDSRDPATAEMMEDLIEGADVVAGSHDSLGGAFLVTASFFRPDALEVAADETGGGFLTRDNRSSFVKLGRKSGYHLCLVEARDEDFHVAVPEL